MNKLTVVMLIILGVAAVAIADVFIKKVTSGTDNFWVAAKNPLMLAVIGLYLVQIIIFSYVFIRKAELSSVGIIQTALYALIVIGSGVLFFKEDITMQKGIGMTLAILGVLLINW